jgi:hypothetical protein
LDPEAWSLGIADHGLLTGLTDDDHPQYALADKTRPAVWVEAADLAARSIADLGTRTHSLLTGLGADDHTQYLLASGARALTGHWDVGGFRIENLGAPTAVGDAFGLGDEITDAMHGSRGSGLHADSHARLHDHSNALDGSPIAVAGVPDLPASKITSGTFDLARIPSPLTGKELDFDEVLKAIQKHLGVFWFNNNWLPSGMVFNVVSGSGSISWYSNDIELKTGATSSSYAYIYKQAYGLSGAFSWGKKRYFGVYVYLGTYSAQYIHIVSGYAPYDSSANTAHHIGFKLIDANLYGTVANGTTESTLLLETLTAATYRRLECILTPGVECRFYVNGVDKGAITTNLPNLTAYAEYLLYASVYNTAAVNKSIYIYESRTMQVQ